MPWKISKRDEGTFDVLNADTDEVMNKEPYDSYSRALAYMQALYANSGDAAPADAGSSDVGMSAMDTGYAKSLGLVMLPDLAVKSLGGDEIRGYIALWGDPANVDLTREFFTPETDFWDKTMGKSARPLTWDHAQDKETKASPVIGKIVDFGDDQVGRWYVAQLDRAHRYRKAVGALIEAEALGTSSDSAIQYVVREKAKSGATWLKQWPLFAGALTTTPCEPRMVGSVDYFKSIGLSIPDPEASVVQMREMVARAQRTFKYLKTFGE
jgi:hypothetical protein